jgi:hypothetical protein
MEEVLVSFCFFSLLHQLLWFSGLNIQTELHHQLSWVPSLQASQGLVSLFTHNLSLSLSLSPSLMCTCIYYFCISGGLWLIQRSKRSFDSVSYFHWWRDIDQNRIMKMCLFRVLHSVASRTCFLSLSSSFIDFVLKYILNKSKKPPEEWHFTDKRFTMRKEEE